MRAPRGPAAPEGRLLRGEGGGGLVPAFAAKAAKRASRSSSTAGLWGRLGLGPFFCFGGMRAEDKRGRHSEGWEG